MADKIVNRVAQSALITFDLEDYYPQGKRCSLDISQWLEEGVLLREKDFRNALNAFDFSPYKNCYVALECSTDALLPAWAPLLVTAHLQPIAKKVVWGTLAALEMAIFTPIIAQLKGEDFAGKPLSSKGAPIILFRKVFMWYCCKNCNPTPNASCMAKPVPLCLL